MNSATRDQIIAAKERLEQLTEEAREIESRKASEAHWEKTQAEERAQEAASLLYHQRQAEHLAQKEKARVEAKAREDEKHLRLHNKTVRQVLSQVAKASRQGKDDNDAGDEGESEEEDSSDKSGTDTQQKGQPQRQGHKELVKGPTEVIEECEGQSESQQQPSSKYQKRARTYHSSLHFLCANTGSHERRDLDWQP